ncbi:MAG: hypothetical protein LBG82_06835, partial [Clostridiales Family XIII bacterium]|nr:hypothetical protein [Clostridiales Family XIII bacterium]
MRNRVKRAMSALLVAALTITVFAAAPPAKSGTRTDEGISVYADEAIATWIKNYGGSDDDSFDAVVPSADGGYVAVGGSYSPDGGLEKWIMAIAKFDGNGNRLWMKNYDRVGVGALNSLAQASDGGYVAAGFGLLLGDGGGFRSLLVKFDESGNQVWEKNY